MKSIFAKATVVATALTMALVLGLVCAPVGVNGISTAAAADKPEPATGGRLGGILIPPPPRGGPQNPHPPTCPTRTNC